MRRRARSRGPCASSDLAVREHRSLGADARRSTLLDLYAAAARAVDGRHAVARALEGDPADGPLSLLAIGKAAGAMALGALEVLGARVRRGLVITRAGHLDAELKAHPQIRCLEGDHPVPGPRSLAAGNEVLEFVAATAPGERVLVLVSGGASSLVEALPEGVTPADLARLNEWGLASGRPITELNALRRRVSRLKGGRLATLLGAARAEALLISDVPGDDPALIGSGLVAAAPPAPLPAGLPDWVLALVASDHGLAGGSTMPARVVATLEDAFAAVEAAADALGLAARRLEPRASGDAEQAANRAAHELALGTEDLVVWGGETTVRLPPEPGRGGRSQHLALAAARLLAGHDDLVLLAAGTDGSDGNSDDAGAIVDGGTIARGQAAGLEVDAVLAAADAGRFLEVSGDLLHTGPTGTNVGDLVLGLRHAPAIPGEDEDEDAGHEADGDAREG
jgi:glycerate 2-kinase